MENKPLTTYENLVALSRKRVDEFISENLPGFKIKQEALDADANENVFSMLSSFSEAVSYFMGKKVKMATIVKQLRKELLLRYEEFYKQFNNDILNILIELDAFLDDPLRYCNKDSINVFLVALGNAFQVNIVVYQSNEESCWKSDLLANVCNNGRTAANNDDNITFTSTLHFARTLSPHVYPILPGKYFKERQKNEHSVADENEILLQPCFKRNTIKETNVDESEYEVVFVKSVVEDNNSELPQKSCNELDEAGDKKENVVCVKKTEREERFCGITDFSSYGPKVLGQGAWENIECEDVEKLPYDINGMKAYSLQGFNRFDLLHKCRDGRPWKKDSRTNWSGYDTVRYRNCNGSQRCPNLECPFIVEFQEQNRIKFDRTKKICTLCGTLAELVPCAARKYTAFKPNNLARVFHFGNHSCVPKVTVPEPSQELLAEAMSMVRRTAKHCQGGKAALTTTRKRKSSNDG